MRPLVTLTTPGRFFISQDSLEVKRHGRSRDQWKSRVSKGFSLIELLTVMTIMGIMVSVSVFAFSGVGTSKNVSAAISDLSLLVGFAKTQAMAKATYVRVGFLNQTSGTTTQLIAGAVAAQDGTSNLSSANLYPLTKVFRYINFQMTDSSALSPTLISKLPSIVPSPVFVSPQDPPVTFTMSSGGTSYRFVSTITITPQGEVVMNNPSSTDPLSTPYVPIMEIGIQNVKGATVPLNAPAGVLWIYGSSGQTCIFQ